MARNDLLTFEEFIFNLGLGGFQLETDVLKCGLIDVTITQTNSDATPTWGDYSANEVSTGGGYPAGGIVIANNTYTEAAGVATLDGDDLALVLNLSGFTDAYWAIIYDDTHASDAAIGFLDLGGPVSEVAGPIAINWNASGIWTVTRTV